MKNLKDQKGITLVALVITIIVLLILAGISLSLVVGDNGILGRASNSSNVQRAATAREQMILDMADLSAEYYDAKYVTKDNNFTATSVGAYIAEKRGASNTVKLSDGSSYTVVGSDTAGYTVELIVYNGNGNTDKKLTGKIDKDGKWTKSIEPSNAS